MDQITLEWAQDRLRDSLQGFADDPHGCCDDDTSAQDAWDRLVHIAQVLGMDAVSWLRGNASPAEIARLERLTDLDFG